MLPCVSWVVWCLPAGRQFSCHTAGTKIGRGDCHRYVAQQLPGGDCSTLRGNPQQGRRSQNCSPPSWTKIHGHGLAWMSLSTRRLGIERGTIGCVCATSPAAQSASAIVMQMCRPTPSNRLLFHRRRSQSVAFSRGASRSWIPYTTRTSSHADKRFSRGGGRCGSPVVFWNGTRSRKGLVVRHSGGVCEQSLDC